MRYFLLMLFLKLLCMPAYAQQRPMLCLTFDDGSTKPMFQYSAAAWNAMLLKQLKAAHVQAAFFACGKGLNTAAGDSLLKAWDDAGHLIANHSFSHKSYSSSAVSYAFFSNDLLRNDSLISNCKHYTKLFRFPYLKEGHTAAKRDSFRVFMKQVGYSNGFVTIDASDWYYDSRLIQALKEDPATDLSLYRNAFLAHMLDRANFYDSLAFALTGRRIHHTLLLHHNLISALFLADLIALFREKGWMITSAEEAYRDPVYARAPETMPAGESLIWSLARERGGFERVLRYPAEDGEYEKDKLDRVEAETKARRK